MPNAGDWLESARAQWRWRGADRPPFAQEPHAGQVSVWDFPRPPQLVHDTREVIIHWGETLVAQSKRCVLVLETSHPPSFYIPWVDVVRHVLVSAEGTSMCEWKGPAKYWSLIDGHRSLPNVAWSYPSPFESAKALSDCVAFYPAQLLCTVDGAQVQPQPGGFYGGWITPELVGPFKGEPGTAGW